MQTIGERLEEARKKKGISIREAAEATKIRGDYLQKFESNHFDIGLTEIYTRGFLRTYANFLKLPADRILSDYAALGRGDLRPRQPNREVYGRMDISVASAAEAAERTAPADEAGASAASAQPQPRYPRAGSSLPTGPDPALVFKYIKWGGAAIAVLLIVLIVRSLFTSGPASPSSPDRSASGATTPTTPRVASPAELTLVALDAVFVRVSHYNPDGTEGADLFSGTLRRGQRQVVPWPGPIYINFSAGENLMIEYKGRQQPVPLKGNDRVRMEAPPAQ